MRRSRLLYFSTGLRIFFSDSVCSDAFSVHSVVTVLTAVKQNSTSSVRTAQNYFT